MLENNANPYSRKFTSIYRGIVESNEDPLNLGRCKVRVPAVHGELTYSVSLLPWARPIVLSPVGVGRGSVNIPNKGDIVWVMFEGANKKFPLYLGGTYSKKDLVVDKDTVLVHKDGNSKISYYEKENRYRIQVGNTTLSISNGNVSVIGNLSVTGNLNVAGSLTVSGDTELNNLKINGTCNLQCKCGDNIADQT